MAGEGWGYAVHLYPEAMLPTPPRYAPRQPSVSFSTTRNQDTSGSIIIYMRSRILDNRIPNAGRRTPDTLMSFRLLCISSPLCLVCDISCRPRWVNVT